MWWLFGIGIALGWMYLLFEFLKDLEGSEGDCDDYGRETDPSAR